jgi:methylmalonyl-CoA mutase cobalamin-binding subunit
MTELQEKLVASMIEHGVDAVVISPAYGDPAAVFDPLAQAGIPAMQVCGGWMRGRISFRSRVSTTQPEAPRRRGT